MNIRKQSFGFDICNKSSIELFFIVIWTLYDCNWLSIDGINISIIDRFKQQECFEPKISPNRKRTDNRVSAQFHFLIFYDSEIGRPKWLKVDFPKRRMKLLNDCNCLYYDWLLPINWTISINHLKYDKLCYCGKLTAMFLQIFAPNVVSVPNFSNSRDKRNED